MKLNPIFQIYLFLFLHKQLVHSILRDQFISYGLSAGDNAMPKADDHFEGPFPITENFKFFNNPYTNIWVNSNGLVSFSGGVTAYVPNPFPLQGWICIAPFWTDIDIRVSGNIYYRSINDLPTLNQVSLDIRNAFNAFASFTATWAYVATYIEVGEFESNNPLSNNTFQVLVLTNGNFAFTIFNYDKLMWSKGNAQAGFNAGDSINYFVLPGSFSDNVRQLVTLSNVNVPGKWIFRIDLNRIVDAVVTTTTSTSTPFTTTTSTATTSTTTSKSTTSTLSSTPNTFLDPAIIGGSVAILFIALILITIVVIIVVLKKKYKRTTIVEPISI